MSDQNSSLPYYKQRLQEAGIPDALNIITAKKPDLDVYATSKSDYIFSQDDPEKDNMKILYPDLYGNFYTYDNGTKNNPVKIFYRTRLKKPLQIVRNGREEEMKYTQPKETGNYPFFNPGLILKFRNKEKIKDLYFVEGEMKSFKGYAEGLDIVGLPSIHGFYNGDVRGKLHEDIQELIITCQVENVIFITDADTLTIRWESGKDLSKRQYNFYGAVKNFRESLQLLLDRDDVALKNIYFTHLKRKFCAEEAKGLDDLLVKYQAEKEAVLNDLKQFQFAARFFEGFILTDGNFNKLFKHFGLDNVENFYSIYKDFIGSREFGYRRALYHHTGEKVEFVAHQDAEKFMRVGPDWLKRVGVPNKYGELEEELVPWKIGEITRDYKNITNFLDQVPKYDSFCVMPNWNGHYQRVHNGCYNLYAPLTHLAKAGGIETTLNFLKHVFGGEATVDKEIIGDQFTVALDYLTLQFQMPEQMLPVPVLVSPENRTGKSTFLKWLQQIYASNACILGNDQFKMKFNAHYITKFIIGIDEGFLDVDKKAEKERLKQLATADTVYMENKGMNVKKISYYGKLIICSNDADRVMKMEDGESRWFVVRVPRISDDNVDPDLEKKLKEEIPAWLHFLKHRKVFHPKADRLWFKPEWFITDQFKKIVETTKNRLDATVEEYIKEKFLMYKLPVLKIHLKFLLKDINEMSKYKFDEKELKYYLKEKRGMEAHKVQRIQIPVSIDMEGNFGEPTITYHQDTQRAYEFRYEDWLSEEDIEEFKTPFNPKADEEVKTKSVQGNLELNAKVYQKNPS
ncbi:DUF5906 domain-containing protein [Pontibacter sp. SGAir0037]|uniref:DUF5906 domain-containing protein n=1 Tax=Pontibacter sp. SGAir0037 TaxID=2571030 RepID=UPI0010CCD786|nr:DUF5906 domain-containing protein [Pontibacter sp. SGAir0037]QCR23099.1 hypothetical protein C1N53_12575 [Pontibacter sp. SGAir0037]